MWILTRVAQSVTAGHRLLAFTERVTELLAREIRSLDILSAKKEPKLSASEVTEQKEGNGDGNLRCNRPIIV